MTPEERDLITGLFGRLREADSPSKDRDAEDIISRSVAALPSAPYLLVQTVLVQEQALRNADDRIQALEKQIAAATQPATPSSGSFLSGARSPWGARASAIPSVPAPPAYQPAYQPAPQPQAYALQPAPVGGGFLQTAMTTAAGVAGGALLFEGINRLMGHNPGPFGGGGFGQAGLGQAGFGQTGSTVENVTVNNYYSPEHDKNGARTTAADTIDNDPSYQQTDYQDDGNGDDGGDVI